ncbi:MAG: hypothetical protein LC721_00590 [Actinobacteria bacterium]|nr:hypothetical protein [Actinomycetota bacterium]
MWPARVLGLMANRRSAAVAALLKARWAMAPQGHRADGATGTVTSHRAADRSELQRRTLRDALA